MELFGHYAIAFIEMGGLFAPMLFIFFHLVRPLLFLPVVFICISGGLLFGTVAGTFYSLVGMTLASILFYGIVRWMPETLSRFIRLKQVLLGKNTELTTRQITLLRLVPFIHFHFLSFCLVEISTGFKEYAKSSFLSNIPLAFIYTSIGQWLSRLSLSNALICLFVLLLLLYFFRRKEMSWTWEEFFQATT
ncbi:MAG TPA: VTT domain-containing protein [Bacillota bacterium]|nr:VTT domain-containing protein [Bacillota bacterium]